MSNENQIENVVNIVNKAQKAVIESQGNRDPGRFQHAQNLVVQAKQLLHETHEAISGGLQMEPGQKKQLVHVQELVRQLEEAQHSVQATD